MDIGPLLFPGTGSSGKNSEVEWELAHQGGTQGKQQQGQTQKQGQTQQQTTEQEAQTATGGAGQRSGGGRNAQNSNVNRQQSAQAQLAEAKKQRDALQSKPNKTPADKEKLEALNCQVKHLQQKATEQSETHSRKQKGQQQ